jgi:hypothetical protein
MLVYVQIQTIGDWCKATIAGLFAPVRNVRCTSNINQSIACKDK